MRNVKLLMVLALVLVGCTADKDPNTPESLYRQARAIEDRPAMDAREAQLNLETARRLYTEALAKHPSEGIEAYIRAGLAYDAYCMDDYATAVEQWATAYPHLQDKDQKAWTLLRIGLSQQRLGHFQQADGTLGRVMSEYPDTLPAKTAREKIGVRQFHLQLAVFNNTATAMSAVADLRKAGLVASLGNDSQGRHLLRLGPLNSYSQARGLRDRVADKYPDAIIIP